MTLRTDRDATYPDDPARPGVKAHQQDHDALAVAYNRWEGTSPSDFAPATGIAQSAVTNLVSDLAGKQPLDSDLTAIAALSTTAYGRALLALADAAAGRTALALGTAATQNTTAFDAAGAAAAAQAASQPVDSDLTAIAALSTTSFGRSLLALADGAALAGAIPSGTYVKGDPTLALTYNADGTVATSTEDGIVTTYAYNADGTVASTTRLGVTRTYTYSGGNLTAVA